MFKFIKDALNPVPKDSHHKRASLLGLPLEIRNKIYEFIVPGPNGTIEPQERDNCIFNAGPICLQDFVLLPPICQASSQLRRETLPLWLGGNRFYIYHSRYDPSGGRWIDAVEHLWGHLRRLILQLDAEEVRLHRSSGKMVEAGFNLVENGTLVTIGFNLPWEEQDKSSIASSMKRAMGGTAVEKMDGRVLVAAVKWVMEHAHHGHLEASKTNKVMELHIQKVMAS
jgi:hypothetical protein